VGEKSRPSGSNEEESGTGGTGGALKTETKSGGGEKKGKNTCQYLETRKRGFKCGGLRALDWYYNPVKGKKRKALPGKHLGGPMLGRDEGGDAGDGKI